MRKDPLEIMEKIFKALEKGRACSMNELSKETQLHYVTVRRYVRIIEMVREEPEVEIIRTRHSVILRVRRKAEEK